MVTKHILALGSGSIASMLLALVRAPFAFSINTSITWLFKAVHPNQTM